MLITYDGSLGTSPLNYRKSEVQNNKSNTYLIELLGICRYRMMGYKKRLLLRCLHHFKSDLINKMDHMHISGTESSSVSLSAKQSSLKSWRLMPKICRNKLKPKRMVLLTQKITISINSNTENICPFDCTDFAVSGKVGIP